MTNKKLLEIFKDFEPVVEGKSRNSQYRALYKIVPKPNKRILELKELQEYVSSLSTRYPGEGFKLVKDGNYWILTKRVKDLGPEEAERLEKLKTEKATLEAPSLTIPILRQITQVMKKLINRAKLKKLSEEIRQIETSIGKAVKGIELYFDLEAQKVFIPEFYVETEPKLTSYLIMRTLGSLDISTTRYVQTLGKA
jgi:hypothetical protein